MQNVYCDSHYLTARRAARLCPACRVAAERDQNSWIDRGLLRSETGWCVPLHSDRPSRGLARTATRPRRPLASASDAGGLGVTLSRRVRQRVANARTLLTLSFIILYSFISPSSQDTILIMSNLTTAAPTPLAGPVLDDVRPPSRIPGSIEHPLPPHPLELLTHSVRYNAEYPYGMMCLNDYETPQRNLARLIDRRVLRSITDEAEFQSILVESLIDSHFGPAATNSDFLMYNGSLRDLVIQRRPINLRTMVGAAAWDRSPYVQAVRQHRAPPAVPPADGESTPVSDMHPSSGQLLCLPHIDLACSRCDKAGRCHCPYAVAASLGSWRR